MQNAAGHTELPDAENPAKAALRAAALELDKPYLARRLRIKGFVMTSLLAIVISAILFALLVRFETLDGGLLALLKAVSWFKPVMALVAASPLFASLLVGYGYMQRAIRRRAAEKAQA